MAAEEIARKAEPWFKNMVDGCRLQEKDSKVRLALDWALYRLGENKALFEIVKSLDSGRHTQAVGYLKELETPEPLYMFLPKAKKNAQVGIFEAFSAIGNSDTLNVIQPYRNSPFPEVAKAATIAEEQIALREKQGTDTGKARPRRLEAQTDKRSNR
jgi:HEAT repeat protein